MNRNARLSAVQYRRRLQWRAGTHTPNRETGKLLAVMPRSGTNGTVYRLQKQGWDVDVTRSLPVAIMSVSQNSYEALLLHKTQLPGEGGFVRTMRNSFPDLTLLVVGDSISTLQPLESEVGGPRQDISGDFADQCTSDTGAERHAATERESAAQNDIPSEPARMRPTLSWMRNILSPQQLYAAITDYFRDVMGVSWVSLLLTQLGEDELKVVSSRGNGSRPPFEPDDTVDTEQMLSDLYDRDDSGSEDPDTTAVQVHSRDSQVFLSIPLMTDTKMVGVLCLSDDFGLDTSGEKSIESLCTLARQMAQCLDVSRSVYEIRQQALFDRLTGVYNRRYFETTLQKEISRAERSGRSMALAILDIDHFKHYNDTFGHPAGDRALARIAQAMKEEIRDSDSIYRYGGEEFGIILPDTGSEAHVNREVAADVINRVRHAVAQRSFGEEEPGEERHLTLSGGIGLFPEDANDARGLIRRVDHRLYEAKRAGRDRVVAS